MATTSAPLPGPVDNGPQRFLQMIGRAKPTAPDGFIPHVGMPGGADIPPPGGLFGRFVVAGMWPPESETEVDETGEKCAQLAREVEAADEEASARAKRVFDEAWSAGAGAAAAQAHYDREHALDGRLIHVCETLAACYAAGGRDIRGAKRWMRQWADEADAEIEAALRSGNIKTTAAAQVAINTIQLKYRTLVIERGIETQAHINGYAVDHVMPLGNGIAAQHGGPPPRSPQERADDGDQLGTDMPSAAPADGVGVTAGASANGSKDGGLADPWPTPGPGGGAGRAGGGLGDALPTPRTSASGPSSPLRSGLPGLPSMPTGGGGSGFPLSGFQGLLGGFGGFPGGGMPGAGGLASSATPPAVPSLGMDFGRGLAAGATAAGAVPAVPQAPMTPLTAPAVSAPVAAAPAAAPVSAPASTPAAAPAPGVPAGEGMTPYGSVLPPQAAPSTASAGSALAAPSIPAEGSGGSSAPGPGAGLMPVAGRRDGAPVRRDLAESDVERGRIAVAELAGAASMTDPGLDWAVAVGRNRTSGMTTLWVATNDGATYIPPGVHLRKTMPVAAKFDEDFDARWFGWVNPADKAVRAARACGDDVGAVATTWAYPSDYLAEYPAVREVATGVPPAGLDTPAAKLLPSRSHRLQTVDAALYADLKGAGESVVGEYCRELVRRLVFGAAGDDLPAVAQSVAQALVAQRWPKAEEWAALGAEYDDTRLLMGAQRPGLNGVEDQEQMLSYAKLFAKARQLEALVCFERYGGDLANVVYAAWVAGVRIELARR